MTNLKKTPLLLIIINSFFVLVAILILINFFTKIFTKYFFQKKQDTFSVTKERIEIKIPAKGFIVKQETIYKAPIDGKVKRIKQPPDLLAKNEEAVQIINSVSKNTVSLKTTDPGFITYIKDGCEELLSIDKLSKKSLNEEDIINLQINQTKVADDQEVKKGEFIFKIIENNFLQYYLLIDKKEAEKISLREDLIFTITDPQNITTDGKIIKVTPINEKKILVIFETTFYIEPLINLRKINGSFTFPYITGNYVPPKAIGKKKDSKGIDKFYVLVKTEDEGKIFSKLTEVKIIGQSAFSNDYIIEPISDSLRIFYDFQKAEKKYLTSGK